jgi:uncharacterized protein with FMN-binding domain
MTDGGGMIPRKAAWASLITVCGLVLLFSFKTPGAASLAVANGATGDQAVVDSGGTVAATAAPTAGATADIGTTDSSSSATTEATPAPSTTTTTAGYQDGTYTGSTITTRYGDVEVQVTISGGQITDVTALALPDRDNHSARISSQAEPILREEALTAQSANIDLLSGATYTSDGYERSLQAALDQALG